MAKNSGNRTNGNIINSHPNVFIQAGKNIHVKGDVNIMNRRARLDQDANDMQDLMIEVTTSLQELGINLNIENLVIDLLNSLFNPTLDGQNHGKLKVKIATLALFLYGAKKVNSSQEFLSEFLRSKDENNVYANLYRQVVMEKNNNNFDNTEAGMYCDEIITFLNEQGLKFRNPAYPAGVSAPRLRSDFLPQDLAVTGNSHQIGSEHLPDPRNRSRIEITNLGSSTLLSNLDDNDGEEENPFDADDEALNRFLNLSSSPHNPVSVRGNRPNRGSTPHNGGGNGRRTPISQSNDSDNKFSKTFIIFTSVCAVVIFALSLYFTFDYLSSESSLENTPTPTLPSDLPSNDLVINPNIVNPASNIPVYTGTPVPAVSGNIVVSGNNSSVNTSTDEQRSNTLVNPTNPNINLPKISTFSGEYFKIVDYSSVIIFFACALLLVGVTGWDGHSRKEYKLLYVYLGMVSFYILSLFVIDKEWMAFLSVDFFVNNKTMAVYALGFTIIFSSLVISFLGDTYSFIPLANSMVLVASTTYFFDQFSIVTGQAGYFRMAMFFIAVVIILVQIYFEDGLKGIGYGALSVLLIIVGNALLTLVLEAGITSQVVYDQDIIHGLTFSGSFIIVCLLSIQGLGAFSGTLTNIISKSDGEPFSFTQTVAHELVLLPIYLNIAGVVLFPGLLEKMNTFIISYILG